MADAVDAEPDHLCEHIEDGTSPKAAVKNEVWAVAEPNQYSDDTYQTLNDIL